MGESLGGRTFMEWPNVIMIFTILFSEAQQMRGLGFNEVILFLVLLRRAGQRLETAGWRTAKAVFDGSKRFPSADTNCFALNQNYATGEEIVR
ncbi:MAG: hypothetical protein IPQ00_10675 [Chloracidobacterium sp.]|nr:hypothetical protein [Chloracidobacterium sp.]